MQLNEFELSSRIICGVLYNQEEVRSSATKDLWNRQAFEEFVSRIDDNSFPCLFARKAFKKSQINFLFCNSYGDFFTGLVEYTCFVKKTNIKKRLLSPLVVFFGDGVCSQTDQHSAGWAALNWASLRDPFEWPKGVPEDPEDPQWSFCFNEIQLFINMSSQEHKTLKNRNLGKYLTFVVNPRENFDQVASTDTKSGRLVREQIRKKISLYIDREVPEELGFFGQENNKEWRQYQLSEDGLERPKECPFSARRADIQRR